jgi:translation initiation factor 3 subunit J
MDDWESEDFVPLPPVLGREEPKGQWDDEDLPEEGVKQNWEDEEKPKPAAAPKPKAEKKKEKVKPAHDEPLAVPLAEKLRQQRLVEEADYQHTTELFGGQKSSGGRTLEDFIPKSEDDFLEYAELLSQKIRPFEKSFHYMTLLRALMRHSVVSLKASDAKEVASSMTVIANEKLKAEKDAAAGKKKTGPKKKQLLVDKPDDDGYSPGTYDGVDDYDFM